MTVAEIHIPPGLSIFIERLLRDGTFMISVKTAKTTHSFSASMIFSEGGGWMIDLKGITDNLSDIPSIGDKALGYATTIAGIISTLNAENETVPAEDDFIQLIVERYASIRKEFDRDTQKDDVVAYLSACHRTTPLDLKRLSEAKDIMLLREVESVVAGRGPMPFRLENRSNHD